MITRALALVALLGSTGSPVWSGGLASPGSATTVLRVGPLVKGQMYRLTAFGTCMEAREEYGIEPGSTYFPDDPPEKSHFVRWVPATSTFGAGMRVSIDGEVSTVLDAGGRKAEETHLDFLAKGKTARLEARDTALSDDGKLRCSWSLEVAPTGT
jgi:hypothetical protein